MMTTIDGKITSATGEDILMDYFDLYTHTEDELETKAYMFGRVTMEMFAETKNTPLPTLSQTSDHEDFLISHDSKFHAFAIDTKGVLRWKDNFINLSNVDQNVNLIIVVNYSTPQEYLAYLREKNISYVFGGDDSIDFLRLFKKTKELFGIEKIVLEGGGIINGSILEQDLIDEISLLLTPIAINQSKAPSLFERNTIELDIKNFRLLSVQRLDKDCVWLRYKKHE